MSAIVACYALSCMSAQAHPLGNFTINHLVLIDARGGDALHVRYVIDFAEIPTFQIMRSKSSNGAWNAVQLNAWARSEVAQVESRLLVRVDGARIALDLREVHARLRPGAGGLPVLYWIGEFAAPMRPGVHHVEISDGVYADRRIGWKDIVVAPMTEPTHELLQYPSSLIGSPRHINAVTFDVNASGATSSIVATNRAVSDGSASSSIVRSNALTDMFSDPNRTPFFILLTALVAFGLGALHAMEPGHGKALMAFTLVGSRATVKQAAILGGAVTFAHTIGVLLLGMVLLFGAGFVSESIYSWIALGSGVVVAAIGARSLAHAHAHIGHDHAHPHAHPRAVTGTRPIGLTAAIVAATSGGIAPCPAAVVVMLAALRLHQLGYGLVLIVIFSLGLASVLTAIGIAIVHGSAWVSRGKRFERLVAVGPLISAALISIVGAIMLGQGFVAAGVQAPAWEISGLAALAIAGYALTHQHTHSHAVEHA